MKSIGHVHRDLRSLNSLDYDIRTLATICCGCMQVSVALQASVLTPSAFGVMSDVLHSPPTSHHDRNIISFSLVSNKILHAQLQ